MPIGAHMSVAGGLHTAFERGQQAGCDTMQIFSKNASRWVAKPLEEEEVATFRRARAASPLAPLLIHDSYLINMGTAAEEMWQKSINAFLEELERADALGVDYLVTHSGAHVGAGAAVGHQRLAAALNQITSQRNPLRPDGTPATMILLETNAGQGSCLCRSFAEMAEVFGRLSEPEQVAICFDTCHVFASGYDMRTPAGYTATMAEFDRLIGLDKLRAFHVNDSLKGVGSLVDRHAHIGQGELGLSFFHALVNDPRFKQVPMILETEKDETMSEDVANLAVLRALVGCEANELAAVQALAMQTGVAESQKRAAAKAKKARGGKAVTDEAEQEVL